MSSDKIKVCFETTREGLARVLNDSEACPGDIVDGECKNDEKGPSCCDDDPRNCWPCIKAFVDRIEVKDER